VSTTVLAIVATAIVVLWLAAAWRRWRGSMRAKVRSVRALAGEAAAAELLEGAGFTIVAVQPRITWAPLVDGEPCEIELRADYLVAIDGERYVAEVKTGDEAPRLATAATRRQLLEYHVAFAVDGVLLVSPEAGTIQRVEFPDARPSTARAPAPAAPDRCT
jgi:hypothetical protein